MNELITAASDVFARYGHALRGPQNARDEGRDRKQHPEASRRLLRVACGEDTT
jgi:hypothetical protein